MDLYELGDPVRVEHDDEALGRVLVGGWPEECPECKVDFADGEEIVGVEIDRGNVVAIRTIDEGTRGRFLMGEVLRLQ